jgi:hypothetical protein
MHELPSLLGTGHSETVDPVDASNCLIVLPDTTKRWLCSQKMQAWYNGAGFTGMFTSKRPSLLSQT